jgi:hypothetical protein
MHRFEKHDIGIHDFLCFVSETLDTARPIQVHLEPNIRWEKNGTACGLIEVGGVDSWSMHFDEEHQHVRYPCVKGWNPKLFLD